MKKLLKWFPLVLLLILMALAYFFDLPNYLSFETLKAHRQKITQFVEAHWLITPFLFIAIYIVVTALSLPVGIFLSLLGGFLFKQPFSTLYVVIGATLGACLIFLIAKTSVGNFLREKAGKRLKKMEKEFQENGVSYLLFLRFVPLFPFWLVNIAPAFFGISLITFAWTTFVGITPGAFVFTQAGTGLGAILDVGKEFSLEAVFNWQIRIALLALGIFALIPVIVKKIKKKHDR